jgi:tripeptide aminopeptidase
LDPKLWKPELIQYVPKKDVITSIPFEKFHQQIGGDDKAGVAIILCLASMTDLEFKVLLTVGEEPPFDGSYGVKTIPSSFFSDVSYCLTLDRRGKDTIVTQIGSTKLCSREFGEVIKRYASFCGVKLKNEPGLAADAYTIARYCPTVNLSVGYYNPHSRSDYVIVGETLDMMCVVATCIENIGLMIQYGNRGSRYG